MAKLTDKQRVDIVTAYTVGLVPVANLAKLTGLTRQGIYKVLWSMGVDTAKTGGIEVSCSACGKVIRRNKSRVRKAKHLFCDADCYAAFIKAGDGSYTGSVRRQGNRIARQVVSRFFPLKAGHIVHHINGNVLDNDPRNLMVFATPGDHCRHHRGFDALPLWTWQPGD